MKTKVFCLHMARTVLHEAIAVYETQWKITHASLFDSLLSELHESMSQSFALELYSFENTLYFCVTAEDEILNLIVAGLYSLYGDAEIVEIEDYKQMIDENTAIVTSELRLKKRDVLPVQDYTSFPYDSMAPVVPVLSKLPQGHRALIQLVVKPARDTTWHHLSLWNGRVGERFSRALKPKTYLKKDLAYQYKIKMHEKCTAKLYWVNYRIAALASVDPEKSRKEQEEVFFQLKEHVTDIGNAVKFVNTLNENAFVLGKFETGHKPFRKFQERQMIAPYRMSTKELSTMWHPPKLFLIPNSPQVVSKKGAPPKNLPVDVNDQSLSFFGFTNFRSQRMPFGIKRADRRRHFYVSGKSGVGKSCLLQLLVRSDIDNGYGCAVLDPHGDLVDDLLKVIPKHRIKDVVLFDPSDTQYPPSFNPLNAIRPELKMRVTIGFIDVFKRVLAADWTEKMDHVIRYAILALLNVQGASLVSLRRLIVDDEYRAQVVSRVDDEAVRRFWEVEFLNRRSEFEGTVSRILSRLDQLLATDMLRNILGQPMNLFDFREFMDKRKIVLMKVSKGILGAENSMLLGSLVIAKIYEAAMSRADIPAEQRQDFYFYVDEFQNFATDSFGEILSESRKYGLCLTLAHQYLGQLPPEVRRTVFGNVGNILCFRMGGDDAGAMAQELKPRFAEEDILNLSMRDFYIKMSIDGEVQESFSGHTLELDFPPTDAQFVTECVDESRSKYALPLAQATEALNVSESVIGEEPRAAVHSA